MLVQEEDSSPADRQRFEDAHSVTEPTVRHWNGRSFAEGLPNEGPGTKFAHSSSATPSAPLRSSRFRSVARVMPRSLAART